VLSHSAPDATGTSGEDVELARHVPESKRHRSGPYPYSLFEARLQLRPGSVATHIIDAGELDACRRSDLTYHGSSRKRDSILEQPRDDGTRALRRYRGLTAPSFVAALSGKPICRLNVHSVITVAGVRDYDRPSRDRHLSTLSAQPLRE